MSIVDRLRDKKMKLLMQMEQGRIVTEQMKAEKMRRKIQRNRDRKPGAVKAIVDGQMMNKRPLDVMRDEYNRRKQEREKKYKED